MGDQKKWFVIVDEGHKGPFDDGEIQDLFNEKQIVADTKLWNRSQNQEISVRDFFDQLMAPPELPGNIVKAPAPSEREESLVEKNHKIQRMLKKHSLAEKREAQADLQKVVAQEPLAKSVEQKVTEQLPPSEIEKEEVAETKESRAKWVYLSLIILGSILFAIGSHDYYYYKVQDLKKPSTLPMISFKQFVQTKALKNKPFQMIFGMSKDKNQIFAASNSFYRGDVTLNFQSIHQKIMHDDDVSFQVFGRLENGLFESDKIVFKKGDKVYPGFYQVKGRFQEMSLPFWILQNFKDFPAEPNFQLKTLLGSTSEDLFQKQLTKYLRRVELSDKRFFSDLIQKSETLLKLTEDTRERFIATLDLLKNPEEKKMKVSQFESWYTENQGVFFTKFVMENNAKFKKIQKAGSVRTEEVITFYTRMNNYAKRIGDLSVGFLMDMYDFADDKKKLDIEVTKVRVNEAYTLFSEQISRSIQELEQFLKEVQEDKD